MREMSRTGYFMMTVLACLSIIAASSTFAAEGDITLPQPSFKSDVSIEKALAARRSLRTYADTPATLKELSQLLWAAQGITDPENGFRTAPSGMASYPLTLYVACFDVTGIAPGIYRYKPDGHKLALVTTGDTRESFKRQTGRSAGGDGHGDSADAPAGAAAPGGEASPAAPSLPASSGKMAAHADASLTAAAVFVITTDTAKSFGSAGYYLEAGHVAQNIVLQCVSLDMGGVTMAGFSADSLKPLLKLSETETPIYVVPVGKK